MQAPGPRRAPQGQEMDSPVATLADLGHRQS